MEKLQQWQKVKEIVGSALERPAAERRAYLDQVCSHDAELRAEADVLYEQHRYADAAATLPEAINIQNRVLGINHEDTVDSVFNLACDLALAGRRDEAIAWLRDALHCGMRAGRLAELDNRADWNSRNDPRFRELVAQTEKSFPILEKNK